MSDIAAIRYALAKSLAERDHDAQENRIRYYIPACTVHHPRHCSNDCTHSKHSGFHRSVARTRFVFGSNSCGKTVLGSTESVMRGLYKNHPYSGVPLPHPAFHRVEFESLRQLESYYLPLFKEWIPKWALVGNSWSDAYNVKYNLLRLKNGDLYDFMSYDMEIGKFETATVHDIWADEKMPEDIYDANLSRLLRTNGYLWCTVTPINGMPWIMNRVWGVSKPDLQTWLIDMDENPYLLPEAKERVIAEWSPEEREARRTGKPMQFQGVVYPEIEESIHVLDKKPEPWWPIYFCMDAHPRKESQMLWVAVDNDDSLYCVDELALRGTPQELAQAIFRKEYDLRQWIGGAFKGIQYRWIDLSAITLNSDIQNNYDLLAEFRKYGLSFSQANRSPIGYSTVHQYLSYDKTKPVGALNWPQLHFIKGRVPQTYFSMTHIMYDEFRHRDMRDPKEKVKDWGKDAADCVRYITVERPRYDRNLSPVAYGSPGLVSTYVQN